MMDMYARVHSVESFGCDDGWGIRYIVFLAKCSMRCSYCANIDVACGRFTKLMKPQDVINEMNKSREFYIQNKGGLTLSGGECLFLNGDSGRISVVFLGHSLQIALSRHSF